MYNGKPEIRINVASQLEERTKFDQGPLADASASFNARSSFDNALSTSIFSLVPIIWLDSLKYSQV